MAQTDVAPAVLGIIDDRQLKQLRNAAYLARTGNLSEIEIEYLIAAMGPLLDELAMHRAADIAVAEFLTTNVVPLFTAGNTKISGPTGPSLPAA